MFDTWLVSSILTIVGEEDLWRSKLQLVIQQNSADTTNTCSGGSKMDLLNIIQLPVLEGSQRLSVDIVLHSRRKLGKRCEKIKMIHTEIFMFAWFSSNTNYKGELVQLTKLQCSTCLDLLIFTTVDVCLHPRKTYCLKIKSLFQGS